jgi:predicted dehydrogenase
MIYDIALEYDASAQCMGGLHFNNVVAAHATHRFEWCIDGTEGSLVGSQEELIFCPKSNPRQRCITQIEGRWFPDAFGGSMGEMLDAIAEGRRPLTHGRDNLESIAIADAAVRSSESHEATAVEW